MDEEHRRPNNNQVEPVVHGNGNDPLSLSEKSIANRERHQQETQGKDRSMLKEMQKVLTEDSGPMSPHLEAKISLKPSKICTIVLALLSSSLYSQWTSEKLLFSFFFCWFVTLSLIFFCFLPIFLFYSVCLLSLFSNLSL